MSKEEKKAARASKAKRKKLQKQLGWALFVVAIVGGLVWLASGDGGSNRVVLETPDDTTVLYEDDHIKGGESARVTLVEFGDFQCPACSRMSSVVKEIGDHFGEELRIVYRHFPLSIHPNAQSSAQAAEAAARQGKFWEMHDLLYEKQNDWASLDNPVNAYTQLADELGLNLDQFGNDFTSGAVKDKIRRDAQQASELKLGGTPSFLLNGQYIDTPGSYEEFVTMIEAAIDSAPIPESAYKEVHEHADFAVYINGKQIDFTDEKYQSGEDNPLHDYTHLHDGNGHVIHKHRTGVTIGELFESIGMGLTKACFTLDDGDSYCNSNTKSLKMFVNGEESTQYGNYEIEDLDQILISYGPKDEDVQKQLDSLTDDACIYSETCPERGTPPDEACVGGLGTSCEDGHSHDEDDSHDE